MKSKVLKINTAGKWEFVEVEGTRADPIPLKTLQEAVGGDIECWNLDVVGLPDIDLWLNEEGKIKGLPLNPFASLVSGIFQFNNVIVGNVILCSSTGAGISVGLNAKQEEALRKHIAKVERMIKNHRERKAK